MTTTEVASQLDLGRRSTYERLKRLVDHDRLETKKVGGNGRVWWQPVTDGQAITTGQEMEALDSDLGAVYDRISDSFYALDEELRFRYLNDHAVDFLGLGADAIGSDIRDQKLTETFESALYEALETQEAVVFEDYYPPWDKWFQNAIYPSESGLSVYSRDITERKRRERELSRYETIVETSPIGITIVGSDGKMQFANDRAEEIYGRSKDQINELTFDDSDWNEVSVDGEPIPDDEKPFPKIIESGEPVFDYVSGVSCPDGERVWISVNGAPVSDDSGKIESVVFAIEDITERRDQQRALEESERRYRTLVKNFPNGAVGLFDHDMQFTAVGGELLDAVGVSPGDRIGNSIYDSYPDDLVEEIEPYFEAALEGEPNSFELEYYDRNLSVYTLPVRSADDEVYAGMVVTQDVTERREYQRALEESNERLEQFAYAASHDLQEPLRMVTSYLQLLERRHGDTLDEDGEEFLAFAVDGATRMRQMINGLLEYSRIETRGDPFEPVDLNDVLDDVRKDLQMQIEERNAEITADDLPEVAGDDSQLRQVFQNLLGNAIEYSGDELPQIDISSRRDDDQWIISVADNGIGIDQDDQERIFEVFQRLHTHEEHSGTGIGLALSRRVVERHGGKIWVDSEPGEGATFSFTLSAIDT
ncbi:PAS domain-containing protein [Halobacteria archaeon AArc-dxtr1]|nr:PAS domain-containing protein [Halobacteria archaeon AArc-dxtr1]